MKSRENLVIDASGWVLGRIASYAAKQALLGKSVVIVNCNMALLTGKKRMVIKEYQIIRKKGGTSLKGPFFPKQSERIMKRTVRGMLSYTQQRGLDALKRVICYSNTPKEYEQAKKISLARKMRITTSTLGEISKEI